MCRKRAPLVCNFVIFVFFDTITLIYGELCEVPFDFARPSESLRGEGTWPVLELFGPHYS